MTQPATFHRHVNTLRRSRSHTSARLPWGSHAASGAEDPISMWMTRTFQIPHLQGEGGAVSYLAHCPTLHGDTRLVFSSATPFVFGLRLSSYYSPEAFLNPNAPQTCSNTWKYKTMIIIDADADYLLSRPVVGQWFDWRVTVHCKNVPGQFSN